MLTLTKSLLALMIGFLLSTAFGLILIPLLKKIKAGQKINIYVENHLRKSGTPTMGGLIFILPTIITTIILIVTNKIEFSVNLLIVLFVFISYSLIGFLDDYLSIKQNHNKGLTEIQKLILQFIVALIFYILYRKYTNASSVLEITLLNIKWNLDWFYGVFILFLLVGASNAVNLTDGLDGLACSNLIFSFIACSIICLLSGNIDIAIISSSITGALIGFLYYNKHKAQVFMGDTGSLALGGVLGTVAVMGKFELLLVLIGAIYMIETLSVIIQVASFKMFGRRVFKMSPIHHHFELSGYSENQIVIASSLITLILSTIAIIIYIKF